MNDTFFDTAAAALPRLCFEQPPVCGLILGSGWSQVLTTDKPLLRLPYADIPGLGASTVVGHAGALLLFERHGIRIAAFLGRRHWYEGAGWGPVVLPIELLRRMGTKNLLITNASGGINPGLKPGDLMVIRDHINTVGINPLIGPVVPGWGQRFPDQSQIYHPTLIDLLRKAAYDAEVQLSDGVYAFTSGPGYETPAEIRAYAGMGADAVGMSTVPEVLAAAHMGMETLGISCITNVNDPDQQAPATHGDVVATAEHGAANLIRLLTEVCSQWPN